ncbi:MAG TPA: hypothetical protein DG048_25435 [Pseudoalteromonas sp.]|nr:hypothetical protein [Pseudoalteromonas sp.]
MLLSNRFVLLNKNDVNKFPGSNHRVVESALRLLRSRGVDVQTTVQEGYEGAAIINDYINRLGSNQRQKNDTLQSLLTDAQKNLLHIGELEWIQKDERACYWLFYCILFHLDDWLLNKPYGFCPVKEMNLHFSPSNSQGRFQQIVNFFDRCGSDLEWQRSLLAKMQNNWSAIYTARKPLRWLDRNNESQCKWAWDYLYNTRWQKNTPSIAGLNPTGCRETYLAIYAAFDSWVTEPEFKRLFLNDFNRAWQQKKHRDNRQGKKACNLVLREEVKQKLDAMAAARGMKLNQLVETLIENEHAKTIQLK